MKSLSSSAGSDKDLLKRTSSESLDVEDDSETLDQRASNLGKDYRQHERFWYDDRMIYLATSDHILYKLPLLLFPDSTYLASLTRNYRPNPRKDDPLPQLRLIRVDGAVYHILEDVTSAELDALVSILTPSYIESRPEVSSYEGLAAALKLSTRWGLASVRRFVLRRLDEIVQPVQRLALARSCDVEKWLSRALVTLCERPEPLTLDDILQMTPEDIALVTQVREQARALVAPVAPKSADVARLIEDLSSSSRMRRKKLAKPSASMEVSDPSRSTEEHKPPHTTPEPAENKSSLDIAPRPTKSTEPTDATTSPQPVFVFGKPLPVSPGERPATPGSPTHSSSAASGPDSGHEQENPAEKDKYAEKSLRKTRPLPHKTQSPRLSLDDIKKWTPRSSASSSKKTTTASPAR